MTPGVVINGAPAAALNQMVPDQATGFALNGAMQRNRRRHSDRHAIDQLPEIAARRIPLQEFSDGHQIRDIPRQYHARIYHGLPSPRHRCLARNGILIAGTLPNGFYLLRSLSRDPRIDAASLAALVDLQSVERDDLLVAGPDAGRRTAQTRSGRRCNSALPAYRPQRYPGSRR